MSLESCISKTIVEYIDTAITSPPEHQPLQDATDVYDSFVKDFERLSAGINMKQVYQRKPDDPAYLPVSDPFAINLARLFLAFRAREQVPLALRPQPEPPLPLDSVVLARVTKRTFDRVLFFIANANERASSEKIHGNDLVSDRAYEEYKHVSLRISNIPPYVKKADDPHWLERYSDHAIKIVQALLAIQARLDSRSETATEQIHQPVPVPALESVILKDLTHQKFLDVLNSALQKARATRQSAPSIPTSGTPTLTERSMDVDSENDMLSEPDSNDQDDLDSECGTDSDNDSFDYDVSTDDEEIEIVPKAELSDDLVDDVIMFESMEDYQKAFEDWNENEADEPLHQDVIGPLLDSPDKETRTITIHLLLEVLGVAKAPIPEMKKNVQIALRELRRLYRIAHTRPWRYSSEAYERTVTPFVYCYSVLSDSAFMMRCFSRVFLFPDASEIMTNAVAGLTLMRKELRKIDRSLEGLPDCQRVMAERTRIARVRIKAFLDTLVHMAQISTAFAKTYTVVEVGGRRMPEINVKHNNGLNLNTAVQNFKGFAISRLGMDYFPEFPGSLVKGCHILLILDKVYGLKFVAEFRKNKEIKKAANTAGELLRKWHQRSLHSHNSLFVVLQ